MSKLCLNSDFYGSTKIESKTTLNRFNFNFGTDRLNKSYIKRLAILDEVEHINEMVKPIEFESYYEYYMINTFKRGKSDSGRVNINGLKGLRAATYYKKIKRDDCNHKNPNINEIQLGKPLNDNLDNRSNIDCGGISKTGNQEIDSRHTRLRSQILQNSEEINNISMCAESSDIDQLKENDRKAKTVNLIIGDISVTSIIPKGSIEGNIRRSLRLTQKEKGKLDNYMNHQTAFDHVSNCSHQIIRDLYENLVPKEIEPVRRSDWVLPTKDRFIPEKQTPFKYVPEELKVKELVDHKRIKTVLSRFEGGLAGIRSK